MKLLQIQPVFQARNDSALPGYLGSMLRGIFGRTLREYDAGLYDKFFHPRIAASNPAFKYTGTNPPAPFMISPAHQMQFIRHGETIKFTLTLFGEYRLYEPQIREVFHRMAERKWYHNRLRVAFQSVSVLTTATGKPVFDWDDYRQITASGSRLHLAFQTPVALMHNRRLIGDWTFSRLFDYLYRRMFILDHAYDQGTLPENHGLDFAQNPVSPVTIDVRRHTVFRHPARKQKHPMTGWKGKVIYDGNISPLYPYFLFGRYIHIGNYTVFGFGKYLLK